MKTFPLVFVLTCSLAQALNLTEVVQTVPFHHPEVLQAQQDLKQATVETQLIALDPDVLALDRLKATHQQNLLVEAIQQATLTAEKNVTEQYWSFFIKTRVLQEGPWRLQLAETKLNIARVRKASGAGTQQDIQQAEQDLHTLKAELEQTRVDVEQLCKDLRQQTGLNIQPDSAPTEPEVSTTIPAFKVRIDLRRDVLEAQQKVAEAELQLKLIHPLFNSQKEQDAKETALERSKAILVGTETTAIKDIQKAHDELKTAIWQLSSSEQLLKITESQFAKDQQKHDQGVLAKIKLLDSEALLKDTQRKVWEAKQKVVAAQLTLRLALNQMATGPADQEKQQ